jgi:hypothetical protein
MTSNVFTSLPLNFGTHAQTYPPLGRRGNMQRRSVTGGSLIMPEPDAYFAFLGALLAYQLAGPGPDMILVITRGVAQGRKAAVAAAIGCVSAGFIQIAGARPRLDHQRVAAGT